MRFTYSLLIAALALAMCQLNPAKVCAQRTSSGLNMPNRFDPFNNSYRLVGKNARFSEIDSSHIAVPLDSIRPLYPKKAFKERISGHVWLKIKLSPEGIPQQTQIMECYPEWQDFEPAAVKAVKKARFQPPPNTGRRKTSKWMHYVVRFDPYDHPNLGDTLPGMDSLIQFDTPASATKPITIEIFDAEHQIGVMDTGIIKVLVDSNGISRDFHVVVTSGNPGVDSTAIRFAMIQPFTPGAFGGRPIATWVNIPFAYTRLDHFLAVPSVSAIAIPKSGQVLHQQQGSRMEIELAYDTARGLFPVRPFYPNADTSFFGLAERMLQKIAFVPPAKYNLEDSVKITHRCLFVPSQMPALNIDSLPSMGTEHPPDEGYTPPILTYSAPVQYFELGRSYGLEATIEVAVLVDSEGSARMATVSKESVIRALNLRVVEAAISNRYTPATVKGKPIAAWVTYEVDFGLD